MTKTSVNGGERVKSLGNGWRMLRSQMHVIFDSNSQQILRCVCAFTANQVVLRHWKHWIMSCSRVNEQSGMLHSEPCSTCIYWIKSQPLRFNNHTKPYLDFGFIAMKHTAIPLCLILSCCQYRNKTSELNGEVRANGVMLTSQKLTHWYKQCPNRTMAKCLFWKSGFCT